MSNLVRDAQIVGWRVHHQKTYEEIGKEFGVSRQRIEQILKKNGAAGIIRKEKPMFPIRNFKAISRKWLYSCGFRYCSECDTWMDKENFSPGMFYKCLPCNARRRNESVHKYHDKISATRAKWVAENPDKVAEYARRWFANLPKERQEELRVKRNQKLKDRYHSDPAFRQKCIDRRESYRKRQSGDLRQ